MWRNAALLLVGLAGLVLAGCAGGSDSLPVAEGVGTTAVSTSVPEPTPELAAAAESFAVNRTLSGDSAETSSFVTASPSLSLTTYDRFVPLVSGTANRVRWEGVYTFCGELTTEPLPDATAFEIGIHNDDGDGSPVLGNPTFFLTVPIEQANQTKIEDVVNPPCRTMTNDSVWSWYSYEVDLADGPTLTTDGPIWISIRAVSPGVAPYWGWRSAGDSSTPSQREFNESLSEVPTGERVISIEVSAE